MTRVTNRHCYEKVVRVQIAAFFLMILIIWLNEILDLPYHLLGAPETPVNWRESLLESSLILLLGIFVVRETRYLFAQMRNLEGILPICCNCKKIRTDKNNWQPIEEYLLSQAPVDFSHSICENCASQLYPEISQQKND